MQQSAGFARSRYGRNPNDDEVCFVVVFYDTSSVLTLLALPTTYKGIPIYYNDNSGMRPPLTVSFGDTVGRVTDWFGRLFQPSPMY